MTMESAAWLRLPMNMAISQYPRGSAFWVVKQPLDDVAGEAVGKCGYMPTVVDGPQLNVAVFVEPGDRGFISSEARFEVELFFQLIFVTICTVVSNPLFYRLVGAGIAGATPKIAAFVLNGGVFCAVDLQDVNRVFRCGAVHLE